MDNKKKKTRFNYTNDALVAALKSINEGEPVSSCAKRTNIPYSTLKKKIRTKSQGNFCKSIL